MLSKNKQTNKSPGPTRLYHYSLSLCKRSSLKYCKYSWPLIPPSTLEVTTEKSIASSIQVTGDPHITKSRMFSTGHPWPISGLICSSIVQSQTHSGMDAALVLIKLVKRTSSDHMNLLVYVSNAKQK